MFSCAVAAALAATGAQQGALSRPSSSEHVRAAAETAGCRLGRRRSRRGAPNSAAPSTSSSLIDRQFEVSALSGGSVGRLCGSGGRVWSGDRSPSLVCVFSGRLCVLGLWVSLVPETGFCLRTSSRLVVGPRLCLCVSFDPTPLSSSSSVLSFRSVVRSRFGSRGRGQSVLLCCVRLCCGAQATAARSALFGFGVCGCGVF